MDNAFERARAAYGTGAYDDATLEFIFPELKESEDERIRKTLINALKTPKSVGELKFVLPEPTREECITYLEKQKEASKAIEAIERIDKFIDEYLANAHDMKDSDPDKKYYRGWDDALGKMSGILQDVYSGEKQKEQPQEELVYRMNGLMQEYIKEGKDEAEKEHRFKCYQLFWDALEDANFFEQKEQKPAEVDESTKRLNDNWMKQHFDDYEEQKSAQSREEILHQLFQNGSISLSDYLYLTGEQKPKQEWSEEDELMRTTVIQTLERFGGCGTTGMQIDWLKSLRPQPKQEWSEEDEKNLELVIDCIYTFYPDPVMKYKLKDWLKSLRPSWKPSEEQMTALFEAMQETRPGWLFNRQLVSLYDDLKKL